MMPTWLRRVLPAGSLGLATQTPSAPVSRAWAPAASAAALSWRIRTKRTASWRSSAASSGTSGEPG